MHSINDLLDMIATEAVGGEGAKNHYFDETRNIQPKAMWIIPAGTDIEESPTYDTSSVKSFNDPYKC